MKKNSNGRSREEVLGEMFAPINIQGRENLSVINSINELNRKKEEVRKLISNYDYIKWLENFTLTNQTFSDDDWLYFPDKISKQDYTNVENLSLFFSAIQEYCEKFLIETNVKADFKTNSFHIKYNNVGYELGLVVGQGSYVCVSREPVEPGAIDFTSIVNNVPPKDYELKSEMLNTLDVFISTMKANEVPKESIISIIKKYYN